MSWFQTSNFASLAKHTLDNLQKTVDKVLEIKEEEEDLPKTTEKSLSDIPSHRPRENKREELLLENQLKTNDKNQINDTSNKDEILDEDKTECLKFIEENKEEIEFKAENIENKTEIEVENLEDNTKELELQELEDAQKDDHQKEQKTVQIPEFLEKENKTLNKVLDEILIENEVSAPVSPSHHVIETEEEDHNHPQDDNLENVELAQVELLEKLNESQDLTSKNERNREESSPSSTCTSSEDPSSFEIISKLRNTNQHESFELVSTPRSHSRSNSNTSSGLDRIDETSGPKVYSSNSSSDIEVIHDLDFFKRHKKVHSETQTDEVLTKSDLKYKEKLGEKDVEISELREEGEKLSKKQFELNNAIKKLRAKEKEYEKTIKSLKDDASDKNSELEKIRKMLIGKEGVELSLNEKIGKLTAEKRRADDLVNQLKSELEDAKDNSSSLTASLQDASIEILQLQNSLSSVQRSSSELSSLTQLNASLTSRLESTFKERDSLRLSLSDAHKALSTRESELLAKIHTLTKQLHKAESELRDQSSDAADLTTPLSLQIEKLQAELKAQSSAYGRREGSLVERIGELEAKLSSIGASEQEQRDAMHSLSAAIEGLEGEQKNLMAQNAALSSKLWEKEVEESKKSEEFREKTSHLLLQLQDSEKSEGELRTELCRLQNDLESERKKTSSLSEQLKSLESAPYKSSSDPHHAHHRSPSNSSESSFLEDVLEHPASHTPKSFFDSFSSMGYVEGLQGQIRTREMEVRMLGDSLKKEEKIRERMSEEIGELTVKNEEMRQRVEGLEMLEGKLKELEQNYNAILQMYGEKVEEADELRMDLQDVKEMYKVQIEQLLKKSNS